MENPNHSANSAQKIEGLITQVFFDFADARQAISARDLAIMETEAHQGPDWMAAAKTYLKHFCRALKGQARQDFRMEHVEQFATACGLPEPTTRRAWGPVAHWARREGIIKKIGMENTTRPSAHRAYASVYTPNYNRL